MLNRRWITIGGPFAAAGFAAGVLAGVALDGRLGTDSALVSATVAYVILVGYQLGELRKQRMGEEARWEARLDRERSDRDLTSSRAAAREALRGIYDIGLSSTSDNDEIRRQKATGVRHLMEHHAPLVDIDGVPDAHEMAERMHVTGAFMLHAGRKSRDLVDAGVDLVMMTSWSWKVVDDCARSLQGYIVGRPRGEWEWPGYEAVLDWMVDESPGTKSPTEAP